MQFIKGLKIYCSNELIDFKTCYLCSLQQTFEDELIVVHLCFL